MQLEGMRVAVRMFVEDPFTGYEGQYLKVPPRNVVPKPLQKPHPPLWMAARAVSPLFKPRSWAWGR